MSRVRVHNFAVSLDGFGAGEGQTLELPFGHAEGRLVEWFCGTRTFRGMHEQSGGSAGVDEALASNWGPGIGAEIMGRNKFGPQRGPWEDDEWQGWWGDDPVFHTPVFVLTHFPRPSLEMEGPPSTSSMPPPPKRSRWPGRPQAGSMSASAEVRPPSASSWPPIWSTICTWWLSRSS
jgi:hypothetical protein